jgi:hypothetical protein
MNILSAQSLKRWHNTHPGESGFLLTTAPLYEREPMLEDSCPGLWQALIFQRKDLEATMKAKQKKHAGASIKGGK